MILRYLGCIVDMHVARINVTRPSDCTVVQLSVILPMLRWTFFVVLLLGIATGDAHRGPLEHLRANLKGAGLHLTWGNVSNACCLLELLRPNKPDFGTLSLRLQGRRLIYKLRS